MFKECQVIMLPANNPSFINKGIFNKKKHFCEDKVRYKADEEQYQHLYILSDDEIKQGNYFIADNAVQRCLEIINGMIHFNDNLTGNPKICPHKFKEKIIATTNEELKLPLIPQEIIIDYIYDAKENKVIVEYKKFLEWDEGQKHEHFELKIEPDNTINIK